MVDDIVIIGGGPVGLYGLYHTGLRRVKASLIEALPELGGQLMALYPEKDIFDVAGFSQVLARELTEAMIDQGTRRGQDVYLGEKVEGLQKTEDGFQLTTTKGTRAARSIIICAGLGAFRPKTLGLDNEADFVGKGLYYTVRNPRELGGKRVLVIGGGDSAADWANTLAQVGAQVTIAHRLDSFQAHEEAVDDMHTHGIRVYQPFECAEILGDGCVQGARLRNVKTGEEETSAFEAIVICIGFHTDLGAMKQWGLEFKGGQIVVDGQMRTSLPGIFAAGDVVTYPGKQKLIALGYGEVALAVGSAVQYLFPGERQIVKHSSDRGF